MTLEMLVGIWGVGDRNKDQVHIIRRMKKAGIARFCFNCPYEDQDASVGVVVTAA